MKRPEKITIFFNLEKNTKLKSIKRLKLNNTNITEDSDDILNEKKMYYPKLYRKTIINDSSNVKNISKVTDEDYTSMNKEITEAELLTIDKSPPNNKTPGKMVCPPSFMKCSDGKT